MTNIYSLLSHGLSIRPSGSLAVNGWEKLLGIFPVTASDPAGTGASLIFYQLLCSTVPNFVPARLGEAVIGLTLFCDAREGW